MIIFINCYQFWSDPFTSCKPSPHYAKKFSRRNQFWTTCQTKPDLGKRPKPNPVSVVERWVELEPINLSWPAHSLLSFDDDKIFKNTTLTKFAWLLLKLSSILSVKMQRQISKASTLKSAALGLLQSNQHQKVNPFNLLCIILLPI